MKRPFKTRLDGHADSPVEHPLAARAEYQGAADVPLPLRQTLVRMHAQGHSPETIARAFELPVDWVRLYVECPPGSTTH